MPHNIINFLQKKNYHYISISVILNRWKKYMERSVIRDVTMYYMPLKEKNRSHLVDFRLDLMRP